MDSITTYDEGNYTCTASNAYGTVVSSTAFVSAKQKPFILAQPATVEVCKDEPARLEINAAGTIPIVFQWQKDGADIPGASLNYYQKAQLSASDSGSYACIITNICGQVISDTVQIMVHELPHISFGDDTVVCANTNFILDAGIFSDYQWSDFSQARYLLVEQTGNYFVRVTDINDCESVSDTIRVEVKMPFNGERLCLVTVDTATNKNMVIWERTSGKGIMAYRLYRQSGFGYDSVATIPFDSLSVIIDTKSRPQEMASRYALTVIDSCGNESDLSPYHQTIHLGSSLGTIPGTVVLDWTDYIDASGSFVPEYYYIYRGRRPDSLYKHDSTSGVFTEFNDLNPGNSLYYRIVVKKPSQCASAVLKANAGPFSQAISNLEDTRIRQSEINSIAHTISGWMVYPNPYQTVTTLHYTLPVAADVFLAIYDVTGNLIRIMVDETQSPGIYQFSYGSQGAGVEIAKLIVNGESAIQKIIRIR